MIVQINDLEDLTKIPATQRSMAEASFELWRTNREVHASLRAGPTSDFMRGFMDRDEIPDMFRWDCTKGSVACS